MYSIVYLWHRLFLMGPLVAAQEKNTILTLYNFRLTFFSIQHSRAGDCLNWNRAEGLQFQHQYLWGEQFSSGNLLRLLNTENHTETQTNLVPTFNIAHFRET